MNPGTYNLNVQQNADMLEELQKLESDGITPIDITGSTFKMEVRSCADNSLILTAQTSDSTMIITDAVNGKVRFNVPSSTLLAINPDVYAQDLVETTVGGVDFVWFRGEFNLIDAITE